MAYDRSSAFGGKQTKRDHRHRVGFKLGDLLQQRLLLRFEGRRYARRATRPSWAYAEATKPKCDRDDAPL